MLLRTIAFHNKNLISKSSAVKTMPTQVWVGWSTLYRLSVPVVPITSTSKVPVKYHTGILLGFYWYFEKVKVLVFMLVF